MFPPGSPSAAHGEREGLPMRPTSRALLLGVLLLLTLLIATARPPGAVRAQDTGVPCGQDPGDADAIAATRTNIENQCHCATASSHLQYTNCARRVVNQAVQNGSLRIECRDFVLSCANRSTCGKPGSVACCRTYASGAVRCVIKRPEERCTAPSGGSACMSSEPSCCDACGPGSDCGGGTTSSTQQQTTTSTMATTSSSSTSS